MTISTCALPVAAHPLAHIPLDSVALEEEYRSCVRELAGDIPSHAAGDNYLLGTNALYHGGPVQWSFVPKVFSRRDISYLAWIAETMGAIMEKLTRACVDDPEVRRRFGFLPEIEELVCAPVPYASQIPIARVDIFLNEETGDFKFCELNTDGSSGMLATQEVTRANALTSTGLRFATRHAVSAFDICGTCARTVLAAYRDAGGTSEHPVICAVDYAESIAAEEMREFQQVFARMGATMRFADIRSLTYENGVLSDAEGPIDVVWRRVVISEMLEKPCAGADALMQCVREGVVPVVGGFRTWPCATKTVFALLFDPYVRNLFTKDELAFIDAHVPATYLLEPGSDLSRFTNKDAWIAKPREGYNSVGVRAGSDCTDKEWAEVCHTIASTGGVMQEYVLPYATLTMEGGVAGENDEPTPHYTMEGLFLFDNAFGGVFTRCGTNAVIGEFTGRLNMGCFVVED